MLPPPAGFFPGAVAALLAVPELGLAGAADLRRLAARVCERSAAERRVCQT